MTDQDKSLVPQTWEFDALNELQVPILQGKKIRTGLTKWWPEIFLEALYKEPNMSKAAKIAGVSRSTAYALRKSNELFSILVEEAIETSIDRLETRAYNRAMGIEPQGLGDDAMIRWYLAKTRPDRFGDKKLIDHTSSDGSMTPQLAIFQLPDNRRGDVDRVDITEEVIDVQAKELEKGKE
jgi:hypothetical protein